MTPIVSTFGSSSGQPRFGWVGPWRPNLPDEADNHLIELAVAAQADAIVTRNLRDVSRGDLKIPSLGVLTPEQCLEVFPCPR